MKLDRKLNNINSYPFHMPGHKRNKKFALPSSNIDITEIDGFDNLHNPKNIIKDLQDEIAKTFGYKKSIISVNGSTCGILAAISAVCNKGDKIIIGRNCHKSVYNACCINELDVIYIEPEYNYDFALYGKVTQDDIDCTILQNPDAKAVVITSPTYEGIISEIKCDIPLIVDAAHGAHFGFSDWLPERAHGDIVVQSLHKTLPALTQCAVIHINNKKYYNKVKKYIDIYETSSPSYILLDSIDKCIDFLKNSKEEFSEYKKLLDYFYDCVSNLDGIKILNNDDITRIIISVNGMSGTELADVLRRKFNIEAEGAAWNYIILISTVADTKQGFNKLINALINLQNQKSRDEICLKKPKMPNKIYNSSEIDKTVSTSIDESIGKICGEYIYAYPPGVPIIVPGEEINSEIIDLIVEMQKNKVNVISDSDLLPLKILTKA